MEFFYRFFVVYFCLVLYWTCQLLLWSTLYLMVVWVCCISCFENNRYHVYSIGILLLKCLPTKRHRDNWIPLVMCIFSVYSGECHWANALGRIRVGYSTWFAMIHTVDLVKSANSEILNPKPQNPTIEFHQDKNNLTYAILACKIYIKF